MISDPARERCTVRSTAGSGVLLRGRMKYLSAEPFSVAVGAHQLTDQQYEIAVGVRCVWCKKKVEACKCPK